MSKHGDSYTRLYRIWVNMKYRCNTPSCPYYFNYGGRGVKVCKEWEEDYTIFKEWSITHGYADDLSIDRIDDNGNYEPSNCRWATPKEQINNTRNNYLITFNGKTQTMMQWAEELELTHSLLSKRIKELGWSIEKALTTPINTNKSHRRKNNGAL